MGSITVPSRYASICSSVLPRTLSIIGHNMDLSASVSGAEAFGGAAERPGPPSLGYMVATPLAGVRLHRQMLQLQKQLSPRLPVPSKLVVGVSSTGGAAAPVANDGCAAALAATDSCSSDMGEDETGVAPTAGTNGAVLACSSAVWRPCCGGAHCACRAG